MKTITHWIGGKPVDATPERTSPVYNPATGQQTAEIALASEEQVGLAVRTARDAFVDWRHSTLTTRQNVMFSFRELLVKHKLDLAKLLTAEHGKTIDDAMGEVPVSYTH